MNDEFTLGEAIAAQRALRQALGLGEETFPMPAFVGMISDEIEQHRKAGRSDQEIADLIRTATGKSVNPAALEAYYATPEQRQGRADHD
jgi:hypothetical protein